jgi:hypothetical protein
MIKPFFDRAIRTAFAGRQISYQGLSWATPVSCKTIAVDAARHLVLRVTLTASEIPTIWFVSQPVGRLTDCNK